jgi:hypothetical protein
VRKPVGQSTRRGVLCLRQDSTRQRSDLDSHYSCSRFLPPVWAGKHLVQCL